MPKPEEIVIPAARRMEIRTRLRGLGHQAANVNALKLDTLADLRRAMCELHGVSEAEYKAAIG